MKKASVHDAELIPRPYGVMKMLAGGRNLRTAQGDLRLLEIDVGKSTSRHYHGRSESIFHVLVGRLRMEVDGQSVALDPGDTIVIEPGEIHVLRNVGTERATVVESMAPPFSSKDIFYLKDAPGTPLA